MSEKLVISVKQTDIESQNKSVLNIENGKKLYKRRNSAFY